MADPFYTSTRWQNLRQSVLRRDSYRCRNCRRFGRFRQASHVHHILPRESFKNLESTGWNLISLCGPCHNEMHDRDTHQLTELGMYWAGRIARQHREETQGWKDKLTTDQDGPKLSESSRS